MIKAALLLVSCHQLLELFPRQSVDGVWHESVGRNAHA